MLNVKLLLSKMNNEKPLKDLLDEAIETASLKHIELIPHKRELIDISWINLQLKKTHIVIHSTNQNISLCIDDAGAYFKIVRCCVDIDKDYLLTI